ncbi:phage tail tape measure protein [Pseudomonas gingeri]|uniref:phage tail tape measure protein n=1 Tax=Pseudomonas gingeri TaxID=117681 RepID=UPI00159FD7EC|nr:phage tail tape measure protein [Pseudomonas gingeri]NWA25514.1 phage tail tape measure protein [Pseudomonas gingeri]
MSGSLGTLTLDLIAKIGGFTAPMDQASRNAKKNAKVIKDSADLASAAWKELGGIAAGAFAGLSVAGVFTRFITETRDAEKEQAQLSAVLKSTGESAGFSRDKLNEMADAMEKTSTFSGGEINKAQTTLLAFTGIVGNEFTRALQAATDMATRTGTGVVEAAETIGRALDVPSKGLTALSKQGFRFTDDQKALAEAMESTGNVAGAQGIILKSLEESYGGAAAAARDTFGGSLEALNNTISGLLTGEGSLDLARQAVEGLNKALSSPAAKTALELTAKAAIAVSVVMVTRLAASAAAVAISFVAAQIEAVKYQLALARMAGVSSTAAIGLTGLTVAARAAAGAMALLGGPVGLAILAASAVAYFALRTDEADQGAGKLAEKVDWLNKSFDGFTKNQAASGLQEINKDLLDAQLAAVDAATAVDQYQRLLKDYPNDSRQREWNESLITAQGELDTARQKVADYGKQIAALNGILGAPVGIERSAVFKKMAADLDEQILLIGKKTDAEKLEARINAGLVKGLKDGEGSLLVAKQKTKDAADAAEKAELKRAANAKSAQKAAEAAAKSAANQLRQAFETAETGYQREIELINTSVDKRKKATEVSKVAFEIESGRLVGINEEQQKRLKGLAEELDALKLVKQASEDSAKVAAFAAVQAEANKSAKDSFSLKLSGAGSGDKTKERLEADLAIHQKYLSDVQELYYQYSAQQINEDVYKRESELLKKSLDERIEIQHKYYEDVDEAQSNWMDGVNDAWANYVDSARNYSQQANDFVTSQLDTLSGSFSANISAMILENQSLGDSFRNVVSSMVTSLVNGLAQMAAQWLIYQAIQMVFGKTSETAAIAAAQIAGPAIAAAYAPAAAMASLASFGANSGPAMVGMASTNTLAATLALTGMAHDGIDSVPADGTWLLQKGERVTTAQTSAKLDQTLASIQMEQNGMRRPGAGAGVVNQTITVQGRPDNRTATQIAAASSRKQRQASRLS